jgi:hypothetical protein
VPVAGQVDLVRGRSDLVKVSRGQSEISGGGVFPSSSLVVPGMGTINGCWAKIQASPICALVAS